MARSYLKFNNSIVSKLSDSDASLSFLNDALKQYERNHDMSSLMISLRYLAEAQGGITKFAKRTGMNRQNLYKVLTGKAMPKFETVLTIINGLGFAVVGVPHNQVS
ncbi:MAG: helix-turn-helix domain-containing protein [Proteobacteria bacterium]|nr:helix-turn-helix domain-containing protein [Pseudomonadota bacterium]